MNKFVKFILIIVVIIGSWKILTWRIQNLNTPKPVSYIQTENRVTVDIDDLDPKVGMRAFGVEFSKDQTVLDVTRKSFPIETKGEDKNIYISSINKKFAKVELNEYWSLTVNGIQMEESPATIKVKSGDVIAWKIKNK